MLCLPASLPTMWVQPCGCACIELINLCITDQFPSFHSEMFCKLHVAQTTEIKGEEKMRH